MKVQLEHILQNLFRKPSLEEVNVEELQEMVKEHPYFSAGHFLLAQKLRHTDEYERQARRAALYFHDPLWLQWQLKQQGNGKEEILEPEEELAVTTVGPVEEGIPATPAEVIENLPEEEPAIIEEEPLEEENNDHPAEQESLREPQSFHEPEPPFETEPVQAPEPIAQEQPIVQETEEEKPEEKPALSFDPYYTIDYFASQGIKAPAEVQPDDRLGRQLKSFTEWLKTMKRLPQVQPQEAPTEADEQSIRRFAAGSLEEKEVLTEAMAEVLQKQGRHAEAIAIYEKLSLSDPSKSAYFAARIENLKENRL